MPLDPSILSAHQTSKSDLDAILESEGASDLKPIVSAIYGQESGSGVNPSTSTDGARGPMQVMPATFKRLAREGEVIDNPADNMRVGIRYIKQLGDQFGNDPARIAAGYFSGEGNVAPSGDAPYRRDHVDGNGKRVSSYVADVLGRIGNAVIPSVQADEDRVAGLTSLQPKGSAAGRKVGDYLPWAEVAAKPEYKALTPEVQEAARRQYFMENIVPQLDAGQVQTTWAEFDKETRPKAPGTLDKLKKAVGWNEGLAFKVPEGQTVTDATFSAGVPTAEDQRQLSQVERMKNWEIDRSRALIEGSDPVSIKQRAATDKSFANRVRLAKERKTGPDDWHDQPASPTDDPVQRFASDKAMAGNTLGRNTDKGIEVLDDQGKLIGHWQ